MPGKRASQRIPRVVIEDYGADFPPKVVEKPAGVEVVTRDYGVSFAPGQTEYGRVITKDEDDRAMIETVYGPKRVISPKKAKQTKKR